MRLFMQKLVNHVAVQNRTAKFCAASDSVRSYDVDQYLRFFQDNKFGFCPPDKRSRVELLGDNPTAQPPVQQPHAVETPVSKRPSNRLPILKEPITEDTVGEHFAAASATVVRGNSLFRKCALSAHLKRRQRKQLRRTLRKRHQRRSARKPPASSSGVAVDVH
jgi:hypothetical protein